MAQLEEEDRKNQEGNLEKYELDVLHYTLSGFWFLAYGRVKKIAIKCACARLQLLHVYLCTDLYEI